MKGVLKFLVFLVAKSHIDWPITKEKTETLEAPQNKSLLLEDRVPPHWPSYIGEKRENFWAKHRG
jgi:hypothetical protein